MTAQYIYTALIDVLAYRARLEQDITSGSESLKDDLVAALSVFDNVNGAVFGIQAISDTIIITCNHHEEFEEFLSILRSVFHSFLKRGLFIRGGVAYSRHFQSGKLTYSHAIARAYELESKKAIYPRIVVDQNIVDMYTSGEGLPDILGKKHFNKQNEVVFINVLRDEKWEEVYEAASSIYKMDKVLITKNESAFSKHQWFENYLFSLPCADTSKERYIEQLTVI